MGKRFDQCGADCTTDCGHCKGATTRGDTVDRIIQFEAGELEDTEVVELFQELVDSGTAWQLQGSYGRMAQQLIDAGLVTEPDRP